jgi:hypothetical protein
MGRSAPGGVRTFEWMSVCKSVMITMFDLRIPHGPSVNQHGDETFVGGVGMCLVWILCPVNRYTEAGYLFVSLGGFCVR